MVVEVNHPKTGNIKLTGIPVKLSDTPGDVTLPPPTLGEHTTSILKDYLGMSDEEISDLREEGVI